MGKLIAALWREMKPSYSSQEEREAWSARLLTGIAAVLGLVALRYAYADLPFLEVFGHDEVHYYADLSFKVGEDGRWLNFLLHSFLRSIPPGAWGALYVASSWLLFQRIALGLGGGPAYAALVASAVTVAPPFIEQSLWPATTYPALFVLLIAKFLAERGVPHPVIYVAAGIFSFGTVQSFYFLLPLFFLADFIGPARAAKPWPHLVKHMLWWIAGAVAGALVMALMVGIVTGHFGVQPAAWRRTQPMEDFAGLVRNIVYVNGEFWKQLWLLLAQAGALQLWFVAIVALVAIPRIRRLFDTLQAWLLFAAVCASFFAFSIPLAPVIQIRSLVALAAGLVFVIALVPGRSIHGRVIGSVLLMTICHGFMKVGHAYLAQHRAQTALVYYKLQELMPEAADSYAAIAVFGEMNPERPEAAIFNDDSRMHGVMHAIGVNDYWDCRRGPNEPCETIVPAAPMRTLPFAGGSLSFFRSDANVAVIRYQDAPFPEAATDARPGE